MGLNYLKGDMPRRAETLIRDAAMSGYRSSEAAYYWVLATLSDRSFDHLGPDEFTHLSAASAMAAEFPHDAWRRALNVVIELIHCITEEEENGIPNLARFSAAFAAYQALPKERRDEIHRHLEMILNGWIQDRVEELEAHHVQTMRLSSNRENRVWKFFEPTPTAPRQIRPPAPVLDTGKAVKLVSGALLGGCGAVWLVVLMAGANLLTTVLALALVGAWLAATIMAGLPRRLADKHAPPTWWPGGFPAAVSSSVDHWFQRAAPRDPVAARQWEWDSDPVRQKLKADLIHLYGGDHVRVGPIRWLVRWHAADTAQQFAEGRALRTDSLPGAILAGNVALAIAGFIALVSAATTSFLGMLGAGLLLGLAAALAWKDALDHLANVFEHARTVAAAQRRFAAEQQEYERWSMALADRPTDAEMAAWLDYDKMMIKNLALKHYGLSNRDVIAHLSLTEGAPGCRRARVLYGPLRYSAYVVLLFLLTEGGVRQVTVDLDFFKGLTSHERRTTFRYEMIASARVTEVGVRFDHGRRHVMAREDIHPLDLQKLVHSRAFRLSLVNRQHIDVLVDNYEEGVFDRARETITFLTALALDTSGVTGALRILEAVSAEGREWLAHERARRRRRLRDFRESQRFPGGVGSHATSAALPGAWDNNPPRA
ncbi:hypothetical protein [Nonomuraea endophytica]|uniref:Uncharacterized protein n=1 Tax=Nonomuraea endophytica TaxID=714136 RepID=A0A7W8ABN6_9ACTN|nr:hypothetical protein [Nonomuraea endophytica]MBB5081798.1 hypothetical protein [Nonomuraea endophytica]